MVDSQRGVKWRSDGMRLARPDLGTTGHRRRGRGSGGRLGCLLLLLLSIWSALPPLQLLSRLRIQRPNVAPRVSLLGNTLGHT